MNEKIDMKKKLLKEALSKTNTTKRQSSSKPVIQKISETHQPFQIKNLQTTESISIPRQPNPITYHPKPTINQSQINSIIDLSNSISLIHSEQESYHSSNFTEKPSCRSAFSESLYTKETDDVKSMIRKMFEKRNFVMELEQFIGRDVQVKSKEELDELKLKLLANEIFVLSLEVRIKEKKPKEMEEIVEKEVKKKLSHLIEFSENEKACHDAEVRIEKFLEEKLRKIRRKEF